jgi:glycosyltransferase involved in cell wall biosynthesis
VTAGYDVVILSAQMPTDDSTAVELAPNIRVISTGERDAEHLPRSLRRAKYVLMGSRTKHWLTNAPSNPAAVIQYSGYTPYLTRLKRVCRSRGIPLLFDAVEWYTADSTLQFMMSPYLWNIEYAMRTLIPSLDGVITISSYLTNYYTRAGVPVTQIPPSLDTKEIRPQLLASNRRQPLRLAYCGSASYDLLNTAIHAVCELDPDGHKIVLDIAGPTRGEVLKTLALPAHSHLPPSVNFLGRVPHETALETIRSADFQMFLRETNRATTAGFPTKFVESMAVGTPVITTMTSDLAEVLTDGENGLICPSPRPQDVVATLRRAVECSTADLAAMRSRSRQIAERHYDYRQYATPLSKIIEQAQLRVRLLRPASSQPLT